MSNQNHKIVKDKSRKRLTRDFIKQVVHFYNNPPIEVEPTSKDGTQKMKLHTCKVCSHKWVGDLEKTQCPKCSEKEIIMKDNCR